MLENDKIKNWMYTFAENLKINGIFTNDFIVDNNDGVPYAIECNPRLGSAHACGHRVYSASLPTLSLSK